MEIEIASECDQPDPVVLERLLKRDMMIETWRNKRMVREMVVEIMSMIPERAAENMAKMMPLKKAKAMDRMMISRLVSGMVDETQGRSVAGTVMKEVLEVAWWRAGVNKAWRIIEGDRRMQKLIEWRIDSQKMEERLVLESIRKEERLKMV